MIMVTLVPFKLYRPIASESLPDYVSWISLPPLPVTFSTPATLNKHIVIIGGWQDGTPVNAIEVDGARKVYI